jgi:hypothetical protein
VVGVEEEDEVVEARVGKKKIERRGVKEEGGPYAV